MHRQIFEGDETIDYAFMGQDPDAADNRWLREAFENQIPIIYFLGIAPGRYQAMLPAFISGWDATALKARVAFGVPDQEALAPPENALERRYALRAVKQRLHQASFREAVITAYNGRCALSGLPEPLLLDAAHIVADKDEQLRPAGGAERHPAVEDPSRRVRCASDRHRPRLPAACVRAAAWAERRPDARSPEAAERRNDPSAGPR